MGSIPPDESSSDMLVIVDDPASSAPQSRATNSPASITGSVSDTMNGQYFFLDLVLTFIEHWLYMARLYIFCVLARVYEWLARFGGKNAFSLRNCFGFDSKSVYSLSFTTLFLFSVLVALKSFVLCFCVVEGSPSIMCILPNYRQPQNY